MNIFEFNRQTIQKDKTTPICILLTHEQMQPYIGRFNYFQLYCLPIVKRYCQDHNIDLVLVTDFKKDQYISTQPEVFGKRVTNYVFKQVIPCLFEHYQYITPFNSHSLLHKNYPSLYDIIDYDYDIIVPQSVVNPLGFQEQSPIYTLKYSAANPRYDKIKVFNFYMNNPHLSFWSGPHIISNKDGKRWFDSQKIEQFQMNDMIYRYVDYALNEDKLNIKIQPRLNMLSMNIFLMTVAQRSPVPSLTDMHLLRQSKKVMKRQFSQIIQNNDSVISYFGGCGSYSEYWKLRPLMMEYMLKQFTCLYY